jgi:hypothetical protein
LQTFMQWVAGPNSSVAEIRAHSPSVYLPRARTTVPSTPEKRTYFTSRAGRDVTFEGSVGFLSTFANFYAVGCWTQLVCGRLHTGQNAPQHPQAPRSGVQRAQEALACGRHRRARSFKFDTRHARNKLSNLAAKNYF